LCPKLAANQKGLGDTMISSPCKTCQRNNQPKEDCYKECELLQEIQDIQISAKEDQIAPGIDCSEENRFTVSHSIENVCPLLVNFY